MEMFVKALIEELKSMLGEDYSITPMDKTKNNNVNLSGISIRKAGEDISPVVYADGYVQDYVLGSQTLKMIASRIIEQIKEKEDFSAVVEELKQYELIKSKLRTALVNYDANREQLKDRPHMPFLDLAIVFYADVSTGPENGATVQIGNSLMDIWGIDENTLIKQCIKNIHKCDFAHVTEISGMIDALLDESEDEELQEFYRTRHNDIRNKMYVVSNSNHHYGASVMLNPTVMQKIAEEHGANLIIYPCSIHELIIIFDNEKSINALRVEDIKAINQSAVSREEWLSNSIYFYNKERRELSIYRQGAPLCENEIQKAVSENK